MCIRTPVELQCCATALLKFHLVRSPAGIVPSVLTRFLSGLLWGFSVDSFAIGCIIAELYLGRPLFPSEVSCDREHILILSRALGTFPILFARMVEDRFPGTFQISDDGTHSVVIFPPWEVPLSRKEHLEPMKRVDSVRPLSVRLFYLLAIAIGALNIIL